MTIIETVIAEHLANLTDTPLFDIGVDQPLSDFNIDSLQVLQIAIVMERTYDVVLEESDLHRFGTVRKIADCVVERQANGIAPQISLPLAV